MMLANDHPPPPPPLPLFKLINMKNFLQCGFDRDKIYVWLSERDILPNMSDDPSQE